MREGAGQRGKDAARRDDAVEMAIFVMDQRQRNVGPAQHRERVHRVHQVGNHRRLAGKLLEVDLAPFEQGGEHVAGKHHADDIVDRAFGNGQPAVGRFGERRADLLAAAIDVDPVDVGARGHHLAHRAVGQADDARDDRPLAFLEHAGGLRFGDDQVQFFGGHDILRFAVEPEQPENAACWSGRAARRAARWLSTASPSAGP